MYQSLLVHLSDIKKTTVYALRIAVGSSTAMFIASFFDLEFAASAGTITLLTLVTSKWETLKLSIARIMTFFLTVLLCAMIYQNTDSEWLGYGLFIFGIALPCVLVGWKSTISVNAVIGSHFLTSKNFSTGFIENEFMLVLIGISVAMVINQLQHNRNHKKLILRNMESTERDMQMALCEMASYLSNHDMHANVWNDIIKLENKIEKFMDEAYLYQENTLMSHTSYYAHYFEMRLKQCSVLHNLHYEVKKIRRMPKQAIIVADYIMYMADYVTHKNLPAKQIEELDRIFEQIKNEPLPNTVQEFEGLAILYRILMGLEDFLVYKRRFIEALDENHKRVYWQEI